MVEPLFIFFSDAERAYLTEMRALTTDAQGREHLVGLTLEETAWYMGFVRDEATGRHRDDGDRYLELHEKHELARFDILGAEHALRHDKPTRQ
jgi:hypothetical protein